MPHVEYFFINSVQTLLGAAVLVLLARTRELKTYWPLLAMAAWQSPSYFVLLYVRYQGHKQHISPIRAYHLYFNTFWSAFAISAVCALLFTYILFRNAMRPLKGLQSLGNIVFGWVAVVSVMIALSVAFSPGMTSNEAIIQVVSQLERASAIIIVSMFTFVAMAIRPMGLSMRSRIFGASVGMLIVAATNLAQSSYLRENHNSIYSAIAMIQIASSCIAQIIWMYYFAKEEPERKFILLPTTSPFHNWNRIAEMLGHEPGFVAIGGVAPENLAGAEVEILRRASAKMKELKAEQAGSDFSHALPK